MRYKEIERAKFRLRDEGRPEAIEYGLLATPPARP
jgi:hypothetical protein